MKERENETAQEAMLVEYGNRNGFCYTYKCRKATSRNIARELLMLFSRVGIPKDIQTDEGTTFMYKLMVDLCRLWQVKHPRTSIFSTTPRPTGLWNVSTRH